MILFRIILTGVLLLLSLPHKDSTPDVTLSKPSITGISTLGTDDPDQLIRDVFIKGDCANVDNIQAIG